MRRKRHTNDDTGGIASWLTTYSDMVTLLMCFWVLLYSMSIIDQQKFEAVKSSLRSAFLGGSSVLPTQEGDSVISITPYKNIFDITTPETEKSERIKTIRDVKANIQGLIDEMGLNENIKIIEEESMIVLRMDSVILFDSGKADLKPSAVPIIEKVGEILKTVDTEILVQGHADDRPINTAMFPSNWELSTRRATNVVKFLIERCGLAPEKLTATGNAEFKPIAPNDTEYGRQKNRRVDIVIFK